MNEIEEPAPREPPAAASGAAPLFALTPRVYLFLALLILAYVLPPVLRRVVPSLAHPHHATAEGELTDQEFGRYLTAETSVRLGFFLRDTSIGKMVASSQPARGTKTSASGKTAQKNTLSFAEDFSDAIGDYRALSRTTHAPNMDRRILILTHALGRPFDENVLKSLSKNLKIAKKPDTDITAEATLWRALYAPPTDSAPLPATFVSDSEARIRAMKLRLLEDGALADLYDRFGNKAAGAAAKARMDAVAQKSLLKAGLQGTLAFLAGIAGFVLLIVFVVAAGSQNWSTVRRLATAPVWMRWGTLIECFLFYLALYRFLGIVIGMLLTASDWQPDPHQALLLNAGLQIGTGAIAVFYTRWQARKSGGGLDTICLTTRGNLIGNIGYGVLGYCATLPLVFVAGIVAHAIFRHNTNTTPNPVLPLMVGTHDPLSRVLIFLMASIAAPFFEELFFRGVLFTALRLRWGWIVSAAISGACFALVHPMQDWIPIFVMGFTFATMREMRQSLVPSMTAHFLQNTLSFLMLSSLFST